MLDWIIFDKVIEPILFYFFIWPYETDKECILLLGKSIKIYFFIVKIILHRYASIRFNKTLFSSKNFLSHVLLLVHRNIDILLNWIFRLCYVHMFLLPFNMWDQWVTGWLITKCFSSFITTQKRTFNTFRTQKTK